MSESRHRQLTVREYARQEGITVQTAYRRIWDAKVSAKQFLGRWLISAEQAPTASQEHVTAAETGH
jgi:hypothetical protein